MATTISVSIPDNKVAEFLIGFLRSQPIPLDAEGEPTMTAAAWLKEVAKQKLMWEYTQGKRLLQQDAVAITDIGIT
jgi:hypothetical protein